MTAGELAIALISALGLGAVISSVVTAFLNRRLNDANLAEKVGKVWQDLSYELEKKVQEQGNQIIAQGVQIKTLQKGEALKNDQIEKLQLALEVKNRQIAFLESEIADLRKYIEKLGHKPPPRKRTMKEALENG